MQQCTCQDGRIHIATGIMDLSVECSAIKIMILSVGHSYHANEPVSRVIGFMLEAVTIGCMLQAVTVGYMLQAVTAGRKLM